MPDRAIEMGYEVCIDWDLDGSFDTTGDNVSQHVQLITIKTGIDSDLLHSHIANVGTCILQMDNDNSRTGRRFSPALTTSPYFNKMLPNRPVRVRMYAGTTYYPLFRGYTRSFNPVGGGEGKDSDSTCIIECVDEMAHIQDVKDLSIPLQANILSSTAIRHVINAALRAALATALITMTANPSNNNTLVVNGTTLTWKTTLTGGQDEIKIGALVGDSAQNAANAINQGSGAATTYSSVITLPRIVTAAPAVSAGYDSSNVDANVYLRGNTGAGATTNFATTQTFTDTTIIGHNTSIEVWVAQSFQTTGGVLTQFTFAHDANSGTPTGTVTWEIQTNSSGSPSGTVLATGTYTPTPSAVNTISTLNGVALQSSTTYWIILKPTTTQTGTNYWTTKLNDTNQYANGQWQASIDSGASWSDSGLSTNDQMGSITTEAVTTKDKLAQSFQVSINQALPAVNLYLRKIGSPTGTMTLRIETDALGFPSGSLVDANATATLAESSLTTSFALTTFTFASSPAILASTTYWLVLSTDRSASATDFVSWGADASSPGYTSGQMMSYASSAWSAETKDAAFSMGLTGVTLTSILRGTVGNAYTLDTTGSWATITGDPVTAPTNETLTVTASGDNSGIGDRGSLDYEVAQSFQTTATGTLTQVTVTHGATTGSPSGTMTLRVYDDNAGVPGSQLYTTTYTPTPSAVNTITVVAGPTLTSSTTYWLRLFPSSAQSAGNYWTWQASTSSVYASGTAKFSTTAGSTWVTQAFDQEFSIAVSISLSITASGSNPAIGNGSGTNYWVAQSVQPTVTGTATQIVIKHAANTGSPTGTMTLTINSDSGSDTPGTQLYSTTYTPTASANNTVTISGGPTLTSGVKYWIYLKPTNVQSATNYWTWQASSSSTYANGKTIYTENGAASWLNWGGDAECSLTSAVTLTVTASGGLSAVGDTGGGTDWEDAQSFQITNSGTVNQITVAHGANTGSPSGTMTIRIHADNAGVPGTQLYSTTYTPTASATNTITVTGGPTLTAATTYWLWMFPTSGQSAVNYWTWQMSTSSVYASGTAKTSNDAGSNWTDLAVDHEFSVRYDYDEVVYYTLSGGVDYPVALPPSLQTGQNTFQYVGDNWNEDTNAMTALQEIVDSEYGSLLWIDSSGVITFKNRNYLFLQANAAASITLNNEQHTIEGSLTDDDVYNRVEVQYTPLATLTTGIIASSKSTITAPGLTGLTERWNPTQAIRDQPGTAVAKLPFIDPATSQPISALSVITPLVATTDWTANENSGGDGVDYTGSARLSFSVAIVGTNAEVTITNSAFGPLFITTLKIRGVGLHRYNPQFAIVEDELAEDEQRRTLAVTLPYSTVGTFADSLAAYLLSKYVNPAYRLYSLSFQGINRIGSVNLFSIGVGNAIAVTDYQTGVTNSKYLVTGIEYSEIRPEPRPAGSITWHLHKLDDVSYGIWDSTDAATGDWDVALWSL